MENSKVHERIFSTRCATRLSDLFLNILRYICESKKWHLNLILICTIYSDSKQTKSLFLKFLNSSLAFCKEVNKFRSISDKHRNVCLHLLDINQFFLLFLSCRVRRSWINCMINPDYFGNFCSQAWKISRESKNLFFLSLSGVTQRGADGSSTSRRWQPSSLRQDSFLVSLQEIHQFFISLLEKWNTRCIWDIWVNIYVPFGFNSLGGRFTPAA